MARLTPRSDTDVVLGDLAEEFQTRTSQEGLRAANRWYREQTLRSLVPTLHRRWTLKGLTMRGFGDGFLQDLRFSVRMAIRKPLVSLVSIASLTVGIALTAVVFTLINAALIRPMAVTSPAQLAWVTEQRPTSVNITLPWPDFVDIKRENRVFSDMAAVAASQFSLRTGGHQIVTHGEFVSGGYFPTLGPAVRAGRALGEADDQAGVPVAVVSTRLWRELTQTESFTPLSLQINEHPFTIVGVIDERFQGVWSGRRADVWLPLSQFTALAPRPARPGPDRFQERRMSWLLWIARLAPGATVESATADLNRIEAGLAPVVGRTEPKVFRVTDGSRGATSGTESLEPTLRMLFVAAVVVLLVACANAANLLLARGAERRREFSVRTALGASRLRLVRLFLLEAGVIAATSTAAALALATLGAHFAAPLLTTFGTRITLDLSLDWRTLLFLAALGTVTTLLAGLAPALSVVFAQTGAIDDATRATTTGQRAMRVRQGLLVLQFGCSVALVVAAVLLFRTVGNLRGQPTGFDTDRVALLSTSPRNAAFGPEQASAYVHDMLRRLRDTPGVDHAGFAVTLPVGFGGSRRSLIIPGVTPANEETEEINFNEVSSGYLEAMGIPLVQGRTFTEADDRATPAIIVNETMARTFFPDGAIGRTIVWSPDRPPVEIVGVVRDAKYRMLREAPRPSFYVPLSLGRAGDGTFHVRVQSAPEARLEGLRTLMTSVYPSVPVTVTRSLRAQTELNLSDDRLALSIGLSLAGAALLLAAAGLFGSMLYFVTQRTREIGVRLALGADGRSVQKLVMGQGVRLALIGSVIGVIASVWATRAIEARLFGVSALDPASILVAVGVLTGVAVIATWLPARRAARVDPIHALRDE
jgi:predicted permease